MRLFKLSVVFVLTFVMFACHNSSQNGKVTKIDAGNYADFWTQDNLSVSNDGLLLKSSPLLLWKDKMRNFEMTVKMKTTPGAEGLLIFATPDAGSLEKGYAITINNSDYSIGNPQKTGSLTSIRNNFVRTASDDQWFNLAVSVKGNKIKVSVDDKIVSEYTEPLKIQRTGDLSGRVLSEGVLTLQKTSGEGDLMISELTIQPLGDEIKNEDIATAEPDSLQKIVDQLNEKGFPLIDFHGHLKGGLTMEQAREHARANGFNYGIAANCGLKFPVTSDSTLNAYLDDIRNEPVFKVMQCEGREWVKLFTPEAVARFDYIFTDAMTWTDNKGRRLRLWIPEETFVDDEQKFMDMFVGKIESIMSQEPVDIYVNPTFLPAQLAADYDRLWTPERMDRVIKVLKDNDIALEINARYKIPGMTFLHRAKEAGVRFTFGTNNTTNNDLGRLEYCIKAINELGLTAEDVFLPRSANDKKVLKAGLPAKITG